MNKMVSAVSAVFEYIEQIEKEENKRSKEMKLIEKRLEKKRRDVEKIISGLSQIL